MKILRMIMEGLPHFKDTLDIDFVARQRVDDEDKEKLYNAFDKMYVNQVLSFVGINASGKTTILKAMSFAMKLLNNEAVNSIQSKDILDDLEPMQQVTFISFFYDKEAVSKIETHIEKTVNTLDNSEKLVIVDETLWTKDISRIKTKKSLYDFEDKDLKERRNQNEQYLMDDVSIIVAYKKKNDSSIMIRDMLNWTDYNILNILGQFPKELLTFLDPSIEYLKCDLIEKKVDIRLKFYETEEIIINSPMLLGHYLSSGTIKGLSVFMNASIAFSEGGYLIVDEIENHFNREIVATLIRFFMNARVNKDGATLLFSTHYSELLNEFKRNDSIYIARNRGGITAENLSNVLKRNDIKKSEVYDSDYLGGTVPAYEAYMALKKALISME